MTGRFIVSPHLDDAVLSCWHAMVESPEPATVVTLFAGLPDAVTKLAPWDSTSGAVNPAAQMLRRRTEDEAALKALGAQFIHCDFLDDQYRGWARQRRKLIDRLEELAEDADEVWLPAGIGGHPDHVLAAEVALSAAVGRRRVLYADLPYAARGWAATHGRGSGSSTMRRKVQAALIASPYVPGWAPESYRLSPPEQDAKRSCIEEYQSQLPALTRAHPQWWQNPEVFGWEWWWPLDVGVSSAPAATPQSEPRARVNSTRRQPGAPEHFPVLMRLWGHWWICRLRRRWGQKRRSRRQGQ